MVSRHLSANLHCTPSAPTVMGSVGPAKNQSAAWQSRSAPAAFLVIVLETLHSLEMFDCHQVSVSVMMAVSRQYITADWFCQWDLICLFRHCEASSIWTATCSSVKIFDSEDCFHVDSTIRKAEEWGPCPEWSLEGRIHSALPEFLVRNQCPWDLSPVVHVRSQSAILSKEDQDRLICLVHCLHLCLECSQGRK